MVRYYSMVQSEVTPMGADAGWKPWIIEMNKADRRQRTNDFAESILKAGPQNTKKEGGDHIFDTRLVAAQVFDDIGINDYHVITSMPYIDERKMLHIPLELLGRAEYGEEAAKPFPEFKLMAFIEETEHEIIMRGEKNTDKEFTPNHRGAHVEVQWKKNGTKLEFESIAITSRANNEAYPFCTLTYGKDGKLVRVDGRYRLGMGKKTDGSPRPGDIIQEADFGFEPADVYNVGKPGILRGDRLPGHKPHYPMTTAEQIKKWQRTIEESLGVEEGMLDRQIDPKATLFKYFNSADISQHPDNPHAGVPAMKFVEG